MCVYGCVCVCVCVCVGGGSILGLVPKRKEGGGGGPAGGATLGPMLKSLQCGS